MPRETTYGFEAEFDVNATSVMQRLHEYGFAGSDHLHGYHCDCDDCVNRNGYPFRGQTDSSCAGEIISDIFGASEYYPQVEWDNLGYITEPRLVMTLCNIAVDVDAEPGFNSGFHVHVGLYGLSPNQLARGFWQFVRWEPVLQRIAAGRWSSMRDNNDTVRMMMNHTYASLTSSPLTARSALDNTLDEGERMHMMVRHQTNDRHSNLNIGARRTPTWEFRLWNSTRAAWRMWMYCDISKAFMDPEFITLVEGLNPPQRFRRPSAGINLLADAADQCGYDGLPEALLRQAYYLDEKAQHAPELLTIG